MEVIDKEICLVLINLENECVSFTNRKSYLDFLKQNPDLLTPQSDILVIVNGGESTIVSPKLAARMSWMLND